MSESSFTDYTVLNIIIPSIESFHEQSIHTIYLRPHQSKIPAESDSRSLFVVNVPIDCASAHLRAIIGSLIGPGRFESVLFEDEKRRSYINQKKYLSNAIEIENTGKKRRRVSEIEETVAEQDLPEIWDRKLRKSGSSAIVLLVDEKSVKKVLSAAKKLQKHKRFMKNWPIWSDGFSSTHPLPSLGSSRYLSHHRLRFPDPDHLQSNIDAFMIKFDACEKSRQEYERKARNEPDADGFVTVTRGGRIGPARKEIVELKSAMIEERERKKREEMQKAGFYLFQGREKRKAEAEAMIQKFEEDKKKIQAFREERGKAGFKPES